MARAYDEGYRREPYRGERGYARDERGFDPRVSSELRPEFDEEDAARRREAGEAEQRRARDADRLYRRDYGPYDYGWGSERRWREPGYGYGYSTGSERRWTEPGWRDHEYETPWRGSPSSSMYGPYGSQGAAWYDTWDRGERQEGPFAGRGPKGYQRSDERIREDACDRLTDAPFLDASDIEVTVRNGEVTLSGTVANREQKRRSEALIEQVTGVREVHNTLHVNRVPAATNVGP